MLIFDSAVWGVGVWRGRKFILTVSNLWRIFFFFFWCSWHLGQPITVMISRNCVAISRKPRKLCFCLHQSPLKMAKMKLQLHSQILLIRLIFCRPNISQVIRWKTMLFNETARVLKRKINHRECGESTFDFFYSLLIHRLRPLLYVPSFLFFFPSRFPFSSFQICSSSSALRKFILASPILYSSLPHHSYIQSWSLLCLTEWSVST